MTYEIINGAALLYSYDTLTVTGDVDIRVNVDGVLKVVCDSKPPEYYSQSEDGSYRVPAKDLCGKVKACIILNNGEIVTLQSFYAISGDNGKITLLPDASDLFSRVAKTEIAMSGLKEKQNNLTKKYEDLEKRIEKLFEGYNF